MTMSRWLVYRGCMAISVMGFLLMLSQGFGPEPEFSVIGPILLFLPLIIAVVVVPANPCD